MRRSVCIECIFIVVVTSCKSTCNLNSKNNKQITKNVYWVTVCCHCFQSIQTFQFANYKTRSTTKDDRDDARKDIGSVAATRLKVNLKAEVSHVLVQVTLHFLM